MAQIVAAMATCHAPQLFSRPPDEEPAMLDSSIEAMRELGKLLDETKPDVIIFFGSDHLETFSMTCMPTYAIVAGSRAKATFAGRDYDLPIHRPMAEDLLDKLIRADFDIAYSEDALLGHTFAVPFEYVIGGRDIPVVPFFTNVYLPPLPSPKRCAALGRALAGILESRNERIALIASGGMSHYPGTWKYPQPEYDFDHWMIAELEKGNTNALMDMTVEQLDEVGNTELLTWATLFGVIGNQPGELLRYTPTWHHGHAMIRFLPARKRTAASEKDVKLHGGYEFKNQGFEFYKHPPASSYNLNRLLFDVRHDAVLRRRIMEDLPTVATDYSLTPDEEKAADALNGVGQAQVVSDYCEPLVKAGAHPLQALMSLHVIYGDHRKKARGSAGGAGERK